MEKWKYRLFLVLLFACSLARIAFCGELPKNRWEATLAVGDSTVLGVAPFSEDQYVLRSSVGSSVTFSRDLWRGKDSLGSVTVAAYGRFAYEIDTPVVAVGAKFFISPGFMKRFRIEAEVGLAHSFGDFGGTIYKDGYIYRNQKETKLIYDLGLGVSYAFNGRWEHSMGYHLGHMSTCAACGEISLPGADEKRNPGINFSAFTFTWRF